MNTRLAVIFTALCLAASPLVAPDASAQQPPAKSAKATVPAGKITVQLMVVHALEGSPHVDPQLQPLARHLQHLRYNDFRVLETNRAPVVTGKPTSFDIEGGRTVTVHLLEKTDQDVKLRVQMSKNGEKLLDTTVRVQRGSTFVVAGPKYKGGILLLPITADY